MTKAQLHKKTDFLS